MHLKEIKVVRRLKLNRKRGAILHMHDLICPLVVCSHTALCTPRKEAVDDVLLATDVQNFVALHFQANTANCLHVHISGATCVSYDDDAACLPPVKTGLIQGGTPDCGLGTQKHWFVVGSNLATSPQFVRASQLPFNQDSVSNFVKIKMRLAAAFPRSVHPQSFYPSIKFWMEMPRSAVISTLKIHLSRKKQTGRRVEHVTARNDMLD